MSSPGARGPWSDGETSALIEAWGPMYVFRNGASLHVEEWRQVCSAVNGHHVAAEGRFSRSLDQCQKRVYTLKDRYKKELAEGRPTPGWLHFAQLRAFLADPHDLPPPGFAAKIPAASVVKEEVEEIEEEEASGGASGSIGRKTVPSKRRFSSLQDILDRSGCPPPGFPPDPPRMPATAKKAKEEEVGEEGSAHGAASADCLPGAVVTKLAEVYWSVELERLSVEKEKMAMERERRAAKVEAENQGETDDN